jgi:HEAT repeat protein
MTDPEEERWRKKYPYFPGVQKCADLLRNSNVNGTWVDIICLELQDHTANHLSELVAAINAEEDEGVKILLLAALAESGLPEAVPVFEEYLQSVQESLRYWAKFGLEKAGTREARTALWNYRNS